MKWNENKSTEKRKSWRLNEEERNCHKYRNTGKSKNKKEIR